MKNIVTTNCEYEFTVNEEIFKPEYIKVKSNNFKCYGYNCYSGEITITFLVTSTTFSTPEPVSVSINGSSAKVKANGSSVLLEGDFGTLETEVINNESGATVPGVIIVKITDAGQDKVKAA